MKRLADCSGGLLAEFGQGDFEDPGFARGPLPLHQDGALVGAFDQAVRAVLALRHKEAD